MQSSIAFSLKLQLVVLEAAPSYRPSLARSSAPFSS